MTKLCLRCHEAPRRAGKYSKYCDSCRTKSYQQRATHLEPYRQLQPWSEEAIRVLKADWDPTDKLNLQKLAKKLGYNRLTIVRRAYDLGLPARPTRVVWKPEEIQYLHTHAGEYTVDRMARDLGRSPIAVANKLGALRLRRRVRDGYNKTDVSQVLGVSVQYVAKLAQERRLKPEPDGRFSEKEILRFMMSYPMAFNLAKVDQAWFMDLITEGGVIQKAMQSALRVSAEF